MEVSIWNNGTEFMGNDFAIDDISLTQVGGCQLHCPGVVQRRADRSLLRQGGHVRCALLSVARSCFERDGVDYYQFANDTVRLLRGPHGSPAS